MRNVFHFLTVDDEIHLAEASVRRDYAAGAVILSEARRTQSIVVIQEGIVNVQAQGMVIARKGPGTVLGEIGFLRNRDGSADVVAATPVAADCIDGRQLNALLLSTPGMATRFYMSIAELLAERLHQQLRELRGAPDALRMPQFRRAVQVDDAGPSVYEPFRQFLLQLNDAYRGMRPGADPAAVGALLYEAFSRADRALAEKSARPEAVYGIIHDLDVLRDSPFHNGAQRRARGFAADFRVMRWLDDTPAGLNAGAAAAHQALCSIPAIASLRARPQRTGELVGEIARDWHSDVPLPSAVIGCSTVREARAVAQALECAGCAGLLSYIEPDRLAMAALCAGQAGPVRLERLQISPQTLFEDESHLDAQQVIVIPALADFAEDDELVRWASWSCAKLLPGGHVLLAHLDADALGFEYLRYGLLWPLYARTRPVLARLLAPLEREHDLRFIQSAGGWFVDIRHRIEIATRR